MPRRKPFASILIACLLALSIFASAATAPTPARAAAASPSYNGALTQTDVADEMPASEIAITGPVTLTLPVVAFNLAPTSTITSTLTGPSRLFLPVVRRSNPPPPPPPEKMRICFNPNTAIPDSSAAGVHSTFTSKDTRTILDMDVLLDIPHTWVGDLVVTLTHQLSRNKITLIDRPGMPAREKGCRLDDIYTLLDDSAPVAVEGFCDFIGNYADDLNPKDYSRTRYAPTINSVLRPEQPLKGFQGEILSGDWTLSVYDQSGFDTGKLRNWCIEVTLGDPSQIPIAKPPPALPRQAYIPNVPSHMQLMTLDCESAVAIDFAKFFGYNIGEYQFFSRLPTSDNPDRGFVGNVWGQWGQVPPNAYGVHAEPVASVLRSYGVPAKAHRAMSWTDMLAEIAAGRPVFVWVIDSIYAYGTPSLWWPRDGRASTVANYEHVAMVVGYDDRTSQVTIRDNGKTYTRSYGDLFRSWGALGNMAITYDVSVSAAAMQAQTSGEVSVLEWGLDSFAASQAFQDPNWEPVGPEYERPEPRDSWPEAALMEESSP